MAGQLSMIRPGRRAINVILLVALPAAVWLTAAGCSDPEAERNERLRSEIILVHDEAMIQTGYLYDLQVQLKRIDKDSHVDHGRITALVEALKAADRAMFAWMNQYQTLAVDDDIAVDNAYRNGQLEAIRSVSRMTDSAVSDAEQFLAAAGTAGR